MTEPQVLRVGVRLTVAFEEAACRGDRASGDEQGRGYRNDPPPDSPRRPSRLYMNGSPRRRAGRGGRWRWGCVLNRRRAEWRPCRETVGQACLEIMAAVRDRDLLEVVAQRDVGDALVAVAEIQRQTRHDLITHAGAELIGQAPAAVIDDRAIADFEIETGLPAADAAADIGRRAKPAQIRQVEVIEPIDQERHPGGAAAHRPFPHNEVGGRHPEPPVATEGVDAVVGVIELKFAAEIAELIACTRPDIVAGAGCQQFFLAALAIDPPEIGVAEPRGGAAHPRAGAAAPSR